MEPTLSLPTGRERLSAVLRRGTDLVTVDDASSALNVDRTTAAKTLARWTRQGWLKRVRRGLYVPVPLTASPEDQVIEDAWSRAMATIPEIKVHFSTQHIDIPLYPTY